MRTLALALFSLVSLAGCGGDEPVTDPSLVPLPERDPGDGVARAQESEVAPRRPPPTTPGADPRAPDQYVVRLDTTKGPIEIEVTRAWSPNGADRFHRLVSEGFFNDVAFFRVVSGFMAQTGIHGDPAVSAQWRNRRIADDPVVQHNTRGYVSYAMAGPGTRTTQFFINLVDNSRLDSMGFSPFGRVRDMRTVDQLHSGYGESAPQGNGPVQQRIQTEGNRYLRADFPQLDYIRGASIVPR